MIKILQGEEIKGALVFSVLLNFKHIFLYVAPIYFVFLLKYYCLEQTKSGRLLEKKKKEPCLYL